MQLTFELFVITNSVRLLQKSQRSLPQSMSPKKFFSLACVIVIALGIGTLGTRWANDTLFPRAARAAQSETNYSTPAVITFLENYLDTNPEDYVAMGNLGAAYLQRARETADPTYYNRAEAILLRAVHLQPQDFPALSALGELALARHQFHDALRYGAQARAINPDNAAIYGVIGDAQIELGLYDEAFATVQTMVDLRPDLASYARVSYVRELRGDRQGAVEEMQRAVAAGAPRTEALAWALTQLGNLYFDQGNFKNAQAAYQAALAHWRNYSFARAGIANVHAAQGDYARAIEIYQELVNTMPLPQFVIALGDLELAAGKSESAAEIFALVQVEAQLLAANGVDMDAELALFQADHKRDLAKALERARTVYARRPGIFVADTLAWTLYQSGDYVGAEQMMQKARQLGTQNALMFYHAARIAHARGRYDAAEKYLRDALALNPHFSVLHQADAQTLLSELQQRNAPDQDMQTNKENVK